MKPLLSLLLLLFLSGQVLYLPVTSVWLEWNKDFIAQELCSNRYAPELMCSGRCYAQEIVGLAIDPPEGETAPVLPSQEKNRILSFFLFTDCQLAVAVPESLPQRRPFAVHLWIPSLVASEIFHPPQLA